MGKFLKKIFWFSGYVLKKKAKIDAGF